MTVTLIRAPQLAPAPYAYAATLPVDARLLFLAGSCPLARDGAVVPAPTTCRARCVA